MLSIDFSYMMAESIGEKGITQRKLESMRVKALEALSEINRQKGERRHPGLDFMELPWQDTASIKKEALAIRESTGDFLLLGIGGSALGPKCILEALSPFHNLRKSPRVFVYENIDPSTLEAVFGIMDLRRTSVNVISKSGGTAETISAFMIAYEKLAGALGDKARERFLLTTDPENGDLRRLASEQKMASLAIPPGVGGRYSVLSPVGLLTAELIGADCDELLRGARDIHARCVSESLSDNPALILAVLAFLMKRDEGRGINVLVPYSDRLKAFSEWFCQLWAESLGKQGMGLTPYPALGATDQHSQLQLWMEGPQDKVIMFLRVEDYGADFRIADVFGEYENMSFLRGQSLSGLIKAEQEATELALAKAGRPSLCIGVPRVDPYHLGQLFHFFGLATALAGFLFGINPFDQPSVEEGKRYTFGLMGKKGYEQKRAEVEEARGKKGLKA